MQLFTRKEPMRLALIDVRAAEVACAYIFREDSGSTDVCYSSITAIEQREGEDADLALIRAIQSACTDLITTGAPLLKNATGSGKADSIVVQLSAPWQNTDIARTVSEFDHATTVTHALIQKTVADGRSREQEDELVEETVLSTTLNGYRVQEPVGKEASTISCSVMRSYMPVSRQKAIHDLIRSMFHSTPITIVATESTVFETIAMIAPFHTDFAVISIDTQSTTVLLSQDGTLVTVAHVPQGTCSLLESVKDTHHKNTQSNVNESAESRNARFAQTTATAQATWSQSLYEKLASGIKPYVLPNTVFLIAHNDSRDFISRTLLEKPLRSLWVSTTEPVITRILLAAFAKRISFGEQDPDLGIALLALRHR